MQIAELKVEHQAHWLQHTATHCNTLQHTTTHCNVLQDTATHCNTLHHTASHCNTLQHTTTHYNTIKHIARHCHIWQIIWLVHVSSYIQMHSCYVISHRTHISHQWVGPRTHIDATHYVMGWLWLVGSIKSWVSFAKETYKRDSILQKRPIILSILLTTTTP